MGSSKYRSYVIRTWSRGSADGGVTRTLIEEVQTGRQIELRGEAAAEIDARISAAVGSAAAESVADAPARGPSGEQEVRMILVVGATGQLGGQITRRLVEQGFEVRILVRPDSPYQALTDIGCEAAIGDLKNHASLERACEGVDTVVTTAISVLRRPPDTVETVELAGYADLIETAKAAGVRHFIYTSALMADVESPIPFAAAKGATAERVKASGMTWTILAPDAFMDVWLAMLVAGPAIEGREVVYVGSGNAVHSFVHSRDVAAIAANCVGNALAANRFIPIGGPAAISLREAVAVFEAVLGHPIPERSVVPGAPVPGLPAMVAGMLAYLDASESRIDMTSLVEEFDLELTTVEAWARSLVPVAIG